MRDLKERLALRKASLHFNVQVDATIGRKERDVVWKPLLNLLMFKQGARV